MPPLSPALSPVPPLPEPPRRTYRLRDLALPLALSVAVLGGILYFTYEPGALTTMARALQPGLLALALCFLCLQLVFGGFRLRFISHRLVSFRNGVRAQLAWDFMSAVTPSAIGGAPFASYFVAKDNDIPVGQATAVMLFSMLLDQVWFASSIPVILIATAYIDVFPPALGAAGAGTLTTYFLVMMLWVVFFAYATLIRPEILEKVTVWFVKMKWLRRFQGRVEEEMVKMKEQAKILRGQPMGFYLVGYLFAAGVWVSRYLVVLFLAWSVTPGLAAVEFLFRTGAMWLTVLAVPTPGGSGGMEGLFMLFLAPLMTKAYTGPTLLTWRLLSYHVFIVLGLFVTSKTISAVAAGKLAEGSPSDEPAPVAS